MRNEIQVRAAKRKSDELWWIVYDGKAWQWVGEKAHKTLQEYILE